MISSYLQIYHTFGISSRGPLAKRRLSPYKALPKALWTNPLGQNRLTFSKFLPIITLTNSPRLSALGLMRIKGEYAIIEQEALA